MSMKKVLTIEQFGNLYGSLIQAICDEEKGIYATLDTSTFNNKPRCFYDFYDSKNKFTKKVDEYIGEFIGHLLFKKKLIYLTNKKDFLALKYTETYKNEHKTFKEENEIYVENYDGLKEFNSLKQIISMLEVLIKMDCDSNMMLKIKENLYVRKVSEREFVFDTEPIIR